MKSILHLLFILSSVLICLTFASCSKEPQPNVGLPLTVEQIANTWRINTFIDNGEDLSGNYIGYRLNFTPTGLIEPTLNGFPIQSEDGFPLWTLEGGSIFISIDNQADTILRRLTGTYIATDTASNRLDLINRNPLTPLVLVLEE
jgi:hypothetical protein